ncbi:hypothetical protein AAEX28_05940 [Lentisphaerota bacterium WC36G]|nr:hypothetical protein LJT99_08800 [Lentisphaerae bacterium WC36]
MRKKQLLYFYGITALALTTTNANAIDFFSKPWNREFDTTYLESYSPHNWSKTAKDDYGIPKATKLLEIIKEKNNNERYPKAFLNSEIIEEMRKKYNSDIDYYKFIKANYVDKIDSLAKINRKDRGKYIELMNCFINLGIAYYVTKDEKIAQKAWHIFKEQMSNYEVKMKAFHYDFHCFASGYDMFQGAWNQAQRTEAQKFLYDNFLTFALKIFEEPLSNKVSRAFVTTGRSNIAIQAYGGFIPMAITLSSVYPKESSDLLYETLHYLAIATTEMAPDGAWREGPSYWGWTARRGYIPAFSCLKNGLGSTFGIDEMAGVDECGYFSLYVNSVIPNKSFRFADSGEDNQIGKKEYFFANYFKDKKLANALKALKGSRLSPIPQYFDLQKKAKSEISLPLSKKFGRIELASFRSSWLNKNGWFTAFKGGFPSEIHGNLHTGTFVIDALGERWVTTGGGTSYDAKDVWNYSPLGGRWRYFGARAESKNCLIVNNGIPKNKNLYPMMENYVLPDQYPFSKSVITDFKTNGLGKKAGGYAILDMTEAYRDFCNSARRGVKLHTSGNRVTIQDEVLFRHRMFYNANFLMTLYSDTKVTINENKSSAILERNGKKILVSINSNIESAILELREMKPLDNSQGIIANGMDKTYKNLKQLVVKIENKNRLERDFLRLTVEFEEYNAKSKGVTNIKILKDWELENSSIFNAIGF